MQVEDSPEGDANSWEGPVALSCPIWSTQTLLMRSCPCQGLWARGVAHGPLWKASGYEAARCEHVLGRWLASQRDLGESKRIGLVDCSKSRRLGSASVSAAVSRHEDDLGDLLPKVCKNVDCPWSRCLLYYGFDLSHDQVLSVSVLLEIRVRQGLSPLSRSRF